MWEDEGERNCFKIVLSKNGKANLPWKPKSIAGHY